MSTSEQVFVWAWLPGRNAPVVAGAMREDGVIWRFAYGNSYLARNDAVALGPELPLQRGELEPAPGLRMHGCIRDGLPDQWGRLVLAREHRLASEDPTEREAMLLSGSDRFGALDFQAAPDTYVDRHSTATLEDLHTAAEHLEKGEPISPHVAAALVHGTSIGGARPKVALRDPAGGGWLAKFSSTSDHAFSVVAAEATALVLARRCGIDVPDIRVLESRGKQILLVRRFDRPPGGGRLHTVSALTLCGLDEIAARYATYPDLLDSLRRHGCDAGPRLFDRIVFNIAISNSDDHARNHAAFWDGSELSLTPAYDLAPGPRSGETAFQAMAFGRPEELGGSGERESRFAACIASSETYGLDRRQAQSRVDRIIETIRSDFKDAADLGHLSAADRAYLWGRQFLNPGAFHGM